MGVILPADEPAPGDPLPDDAPRDHRGAPRSIARTALLALDGELPSTALIEQLAAGHDTVVAADGAGLRLVERGIVPDVIIGDLDSIGGDRHMFAALRSILIERPDQESNDFEKALRWLLDEGYARATVIGFGGGMLDHTLNNASVAAKLAASIELRLADDRSTGYVITRELTLATHVGERISLIPLPSARLTTEGLAWELADEILEIGRREGASNRAVAGRVHVRIAEGKIVLFHYPALFA